LASRGPSTSGGPGLHTSKAPTAGAVLAALSVADSGGRQLVPIEVRPDVGAEPAASGADEAAVDVRQPHIVQPVVGAKGTGMAAMVVGAVNQKLALFATYCAPRVANEAAN